jgi:hypothetical protein
MSRNWQMSLIFQTSLTGVDGSFVNNMVAFVTLESFDGQYADRKRSHKNALLTEASQEVDHAESNR